MNLCRLLGRHCLSHLDCCEIHKRLRDNSHSLLIRWMQNDRSQSGESLNLTRMRQSKIGELLAFYKHCRELFFAVFAANTNKDRENVEIHWKNVNLKHSTLMASSSVKGDRCDSRSTFFIHQNIATNNKREISGTKVDHKDRFKFVNDRQTHKRLVSTCVFE